jgi:hypothetical protein
MDAETLAKKLERDHVELVASILMLSLPVPFFVLAFYAAHVNGTDIKERQWQRLQTAIPGTGPSPPLTWVAS